MHAGPAQLAQQPAGIQFGRQPQHHPVAGGHRRGGRYGTAQLVQGRQPGPQGRHEGSRHLALFARLAHGVVQEPGKALCAARQFVGLRTLGLALEVERQVRQMRGQRRVPLAGQQGAVAVNGR